MGECPYNSCSSASSPARRIGGGGAGGVVFILFSLILPFGSHFSYVFSKYVASMVLVLSIPSTSRISTPKFLCRFTFGMGLNLVAKSDMSTGNHTCASYCVQSGDIKFVFTAPYSSTAPKAGDGCPLPGYNADQAQRYVTTHGLAVRAVALRVGDARVAYEVCIANGGIGVLPPSTLCAEGDNDDDSEGGSSCSAVVSEVLLYPGGDAVLRFVSGDFNGPHLPGYVSCLPRAAPKKADPHHYSNGGDTRERDARSNGDATSARTTASSIQDFGFERIDHIVGNVPALIPAAEYIANMTGLHEFAEFTAEDVGTVDSGLNSIVLANNSEMVLLPVNEPTDGKRKSQIQTYLEHHEGPGVQHLALKTYDIFHTLRKMQERSDWGGFEFMPHPGKGYYERLPERIGEGILSQEEIDLCDQLGILVDKDDQGVLLQIFTKPLSDRPTVFVEIIQRVGCLKTRECPVTAREVKYQAGGCGGFGKGNFKELFKSIEEYEKTLDV